MPQQNEKLKPCPFCGNNNAIPQSVGAESFWRIWCSHCGAEGPSPRISKEEAIKAWNTRHEEGE